jgi:four helix bundle protein
MAGARRFQDLVCWQLAREFKIAVYQFAETPSLKRDYKFYAQIRDAAASPPRNIAEGFGRRSHADFARLLDVARASLAESQNHLIDAIDRGYLEDAEFRTMNSLAERTCGAIAALQRYLRGGQ